MGLRERKKQQTRTTLSWSAIRLIVERGYDQVLVEDIATEAGVSPRTFNNYFSSKAEAVASRHLDRCLQMAWELRSRPAGEALWDAIDQAVLSQFDEGPEVAANPPLDREAWIHGLRLMVAVPAIQAETLRAGADAEVALAAAVAERTHTDPVTDMYPRLVAAAVLAAGNVATQLFLAGTGRAVDVRQLHVDALRQLSTGLRPPDLS